MLLTTTNITTNILIGMIPGIISMIPRLLCNAEIKSKKQNIICLPAAEIASKRIRTRIAIGYDSRMPTEAMEREGHYSRMPTQNTFTRK